MRRFHSLSLEPEAVLPMPYNFEITLLLLVSSCLMRSFLVFRRQSCHIESIIFLADSLKFGIA